MKVARWGNSLAIRLPRPVVEALGLKEGDEVEVRAGKPTGLEVSRDRRREEALAQLEAMRWPFPPGFKFDRDELYDNARSGFKPERETSDDG